MSLNNSWDLIRATERLRPLDLFYPFFSFAQCYQDKNIMNLVLILDLISLKKIDYACITNVMTP